MTLRHFIIASLCAACLASCHRPEPKPVPRRTAYFRLAEYDTAYVALKGAPVALEVNAAAHAKAMEKGGAVWANIDYPAYHASVYCTFTPVSSADVMQVVDNRTERMHLNLNGAEAQITEMLTPGGYAVTLVDAPTAMSTPLQFIALRPDHPQWVVSGSVFFKGLSPDAPLDSVAPALATLRRDLTHALQSMR